MNETYLNKNSYYVKKLKLVRLALSSQAHKGTKEATNFQ